MNTVQDIAIKPANRPAPLADTLAARRERRAKNLRSFQKKYDAMLYMLDIIASLHLLALKDPEQIKKMGDLKSMVAQTRDGLAMCKDGKH